MFKVYDCIGHTNSPGYLLKKYGIPFMMELDKWEFVNDIKDAQLIMCISAPFSLDVARQLARSDQIIVILDLWHMENNSGVENTIQNTKQEFQIQHKKVIWVHENFMNQNKRHVYFDMMFHRSKMYFTDFDKILEPHEKLWTIATTKDVYDLTPIEINSSRRRFLAAMRIYGPGSRMERRRALREVLKNPYYCGYMNDTENNVFFEVNNVNATKDLTNWVEKRDGGTWYPISNKYYNDSYCSIFIETVTEADEAILASEKTFDPLIKGHFILPFSTFNYIKWLREHYDFKFPDWIDYSYDSEPHNDARFFKYLASVVNFLNIPESSVLGWAKQDKWILEHNRNVFYNRPYQSLYKAIDECIKFNGY